MSKRLKNIISLTVSPIQRDVNIFNIYIDNGWFILYNIDKEKEQKEVSNMKVKVHYIRYIRDFMRSLPPNKQ